MNQHPPTRKTLGVLLFPEFETLDVFGPLQMFGMLPDQINIALIAEQQGLVKSTQGQAVCAEFSWQNAPHLDYLLVPGGKGTRKEVNNEPLLHWIKSRSARAELTLSVCTGAALLAKAGVLNGHKATTNKLAFNWVVEQGTQVNWIKKARWVDDGSVITASGVSAGIDMSLYVISRLFGEKIRDELAQRTEYVVNLDPSIDPFMIF
ncbi:DJ-1/PfpI family protein [Legionella maioricensis]|uniref:DJ-1/PfpI family protein n=1 Tax=Legionella maioricensis TaxID=2896528 RepID=A0A9X2D3B8_9GAMM|nr:DJ-1/PfpI family protein [Legionella maioricensis]MCL9685487.1 DJ-1/PfpI family protein [Legionella maioricensis]MCL9688805.1 DJ-1/PfpI family protein [Legionella maioricensis]